MSIPCVLIQWLNAADKDVTDPAKYLILNNDYKPVQLPVQGLSPELEVFVKYTPFPRPIEDPRLVVIEEIEGPVDEMDETHTSNRKWVKTFNVKERTADDKKSSVDEAKSDANLGVFPPKKHLEYLTLYAVISRREARGLTITPAQQLILDKFEAKASRIWFNHINALAKKADIDSSQAIDLDSNWETIDPEDENS